MGYGKASTSNGIDNGIDNGVEKNSNTVLNILKSTPNITQKQLADRTNLSIRTVARELKSLRTTGVIRRIGSARSGYWEILP